MRIMLITGSFPPMQCGVGDYTCKLATTLAERTELCVSVLTSRAAETPKEGSVEVLPLMQSWTMKDAPSAIRAIKQWEPDVVHIQYPTQGYSGGSLPSVLPLIGFFMGRKIAQTWHESYPRKKAPGLFIKAIIPGRLVVVRPGYKNLLHPMLRWALWGKHTKFIPNASSIGLASLDNEGRESVRKKYLAGQQRLIVVFGLLYPSKGVEQVFEVSDSATDRIVLAGGMDVDPDYRAQIMGIATSPPWQGKVTVTGFLSSADIAELLASADAVVFPYRIGGGEWNTSLHGAVLNRAFVLHTSLHPTGYDPKRNAYSARIDDIREMRAALQRYAGTRRGLDPDLDCADWQSIAKAHESVYRALVRDETSSIKIAKAHDQ
jgi:glycosyltransferase involved in cell wall biosynthesis